MTDKDEIAKSDSTVRHAFTRVWAAMTVLWLIFVAWRTYSGWPAIPLDMGGADPSTDAAYQAAQLGHVARALGLAIGVPALVYLFSRLIMRR